MSAKLMGQVWDLDLPHGELWVLMAICDHADHDGNGAHPGLDLLEYKTGYSRRQIQRIITALEIKQIIIQVSGGVGRGQIQTYSIRLENAPYKKRTQCHLKENIKEDKVTPINRLKGDILSQEKVTFETLKGDISDAPFYKEEPLLTMEGNRKPAPVENLGTVLENLYPGYATDFRIMRGLADLVSRLKASIDDVRRFPDWLKTNHPKKANTVFAFKDLFHESIQTAPAPVPTHFCGKCNRGWLPSANGQDGARRCPCVSTVRAATAQPMEVAI